MIKDDIADIMNRGLAEATKNKDCCFNRWINSLLPGDVKEVIDFDSGSYFTIVSHLLQV